MKAHNIIVYETTDYGKFKFDESNRPILSTKLLEENIAKNDFTKYKPILVSKDMVIIDGQHRFMACKKLGKPIYYRIFEDNNDTKTIMITLNRYQKNWCYEDFAEFFAKNGNESYKDMLAFIEKYGLNFNQGYLVYSNKEIKSIIRSGESVIKRENADEIAEFLSDLNVSQYKMTRMNTFTRAIIEGFKTYSARQKKRLLKNIGKIKQCATIEQYLAYFEKFIGER